MRQEEFDRLLTEDVAQIPPGEAEEYTPWRAAMTKILWGMGLTTFRFAFFYLQYLLPLLGAVLLYLGCRTLRRENRWFRAGRALAMAYLAVHVTALVFTATPIMGRIEAVRPLSLGLGLAFSLLPMGILFVLRQGTQGAFAAPGGRPRDCLGRALLAYAACIALALWSDLVPLTAPADGPISFGLTITNKPLYYGRTIAFIVLYLLVLYWTARQGRALAGRGYDITPAPVRVPGGALIAAILLFLAITLPTASLLSARLPMPQAQSLSQLREEGDAEVRTRLEDLGMDPALAALLDGAELARCREALAVISFPPDSGQLIGSDREAQWTQDGNALFTLDGGTAKLSCQAVLLPGRQVRFYQCFQWVEPPRRWLQEGFSIYLDSYPAGEFSARLAWDSGDATLTAPLPVQLGGGQTPEELPAWALEWYDAELNALGHLRYVPYLTFSAPGGAEHLRGWLAWTQDMSRTQDGERVWLFSHSALYHQARWLLFPFRSVAESAVTVGYSSGSPFQSVIARFDASVESSPW